MLDKPFISPTQRLPEITFRVVVLSIVLTILLASSNTYLALKVGILTSASIPAAIMSMAILRFFQNSNILENNLVQTSASAGQAVAGGVVYTVPALIMIQYWFGFDYWSTFFIAAVGGVLGVFFSIPIRRILLAQKELHFPEGRAIAEILQVGSRRHMGLHEMLWGGLLGASIELFANGFKVIASHIEYWSSLAGKSLIGFGAGFLPTLIGAGYIIGFNISCSILVGAVIGWLGLVPILSFYYAIPIHGDTSSVVMSLWNEKIRYVGIGAMLTAALWTLMGLVKPFLFSLKASLELLSGKGQIIGTIPRAERDIPIHYVMFAILVLLAFNWVLFQSLFPLSDLNIASISNGVFLLTTVLYVLVIGFIASAICGYFSGMVGVSASPGSAVIIASLLLAALLIRTLLGLQQHVDASQLQAAAAITIMIGAVITGAAAIANDNIQDLKVGQLVGSTPWKLQVMLILGTLVSAAVAPFVMQLLFEAYGIGGVFPREGMDPSQVLPAPPAALMAAVTQGVFAQNLPWDMICLGIMIALLALIAHGFLARRQVRFSVLALAIGIYLPLISSTSLFIGGLFALMTSKMRDKRLNAGEDKEKLKFKRQRSMLLACGLVAGSALMNVFLAMPAAFFRDTDVLRLMPPDLNGVAAILGILAVLSIGFWFYKIMAKR